MNIRISLFIVLFAIIASVFAVNPNTAVSGAGNYYASFTPETLGVELSDVDVYDQMGEDFTIELWFRKTCGAGEYRPLVAKHPQDPNQSMNVPNGQLEYLLEVQYNNAINFFTGCGGFSDYGYFVSVNQPNFFPSKRSYTVVQNRWTHVAVSVNWKEDEIGIPTGVATLYIDGIIVDSSMWASLSPTCFGKRRLRAVGYPVRLGFYDNQDPGVQTWCGDMDELRIWNVSRSPEQIKQFYQGGLPPNSEGIISYHTFSEGPGSLVSNNIVPFSGLASGYPRVLFNAPFPPNYEFFHLSSLKLCPNPGVACPGYAVSSSFSGSDSTGADFDFYITDIVRNTDAKFLFSDNRNPVGSNIRREITHNDQLP